MSNKETKSPANIFALLGFAILFVVAIWSGIQVVKFAPRIIDGWSIFSVFKGEPIITLDIDKTDIKQGEEATLTWSLSGNIDGGAVSFIYKCNAGVVLDIYDDLSKNYKTLPCNTPYNMPLNYKKLKIKPSGSDKKTVDATIAIVYTNAAGEKFKDIEKIKIETNNLADSNTEDIELPEKPNENKPSNTPNTDKEGTVSIAKPTTNKIAKDKNNVHKSNRCVSKTFGTPDLSIHNLRVGTLAPNGYFVSKNTFYSNETIVIKFTVSNYGTKTSPTWYFQSLLPNRNGEIYTSKAQPAIAPCNGRFYTLKIVNPKKGIGKILVNIDPHNLIKELNEINNNAKAQVTVY